MLVPIWEEIVTAMTAVFVFIMADIIGLTLHDQYPLTNLAAKVCEYCCQEVCQCGATTKR